MNLKLPLMDLQANTCGEQELGASVFGLTPDIGLLQLVSRWQAWQPRRAQITKRRGDIKASGHKVGPQKGSGRARHGSRTANLFRGGAQAHGPSGERHAFKLNKKVKSLALRHALSAVYAQGHLILLKEASVPSRKTGVLASLLDGLAGGRLLIVDTEMMVNFSRASKNIRRIKMLQVDAINVRDILLHEKLIVTQSALKSLEKRLAIPASEQAAAQS